LTGRYLNREVSAQIGALHRRLDAAAPPSIRR